MQLWGRTRLECQQWQKCVIFPLAHSGRHPHYSMCSRTPISGSVSPHSAHSLVSISIPPTWPFPRVRDGGSLIWHARTAGCSATSHRQPCVGSLTWPRSFGKVPESSISPHGALMNCVGVSLTSHNSITTDNHTQCSHIFSAICLFVHVQVRAHTHTHTVYN